MSEAEDGQGTRAQYLTDIRLRVDTSLYCVEAVKRTLYWYTDAFSVQIVRCEGSQNSLDVLFRLLPEGEYREFDKEMFFNRLLDNELRVRIGHETRAIRELIVAKAFAPVELRSNPPSGNLLDPVASRVSWNELVEADLPS